jgi:hypothetical protein
MAKVTSRQQALHARHRRPSRDPAGRTHTFRAMAGFHLVSGIVAVVGGVGVLVGDAAALAYPSSSWARGSGGVSGWDDFWMAVSGLLLIWLGIRLLRVGIQVSAGKMTYRGYFRTRTVEASEIRSMALQPKEESNGPRWIPRVELTEGKGFWIPGFDCGSARKPPKPHPAARLDEARALLGVRAGDISTENTLAGRQLTENQHQRQPGEEAETERLPAGTVPDSDPQDGVLPQDDAVPGQVQAGEPELNDYGVPVQDRSAKGRIYVQEIACLICGAACFGLALTDYNGDNSKGHLSGYQTALAFLPGILAFVLAAFLENEPSRISCAPPSEGRKIARCRPSTTRMLRPRRSGWSGITPPTMTPSGPRSGRSRRGWG